MANATALATVISSFLPSSMVFLSEAYTSAVRAALISLSSKTRLPKYSDTVLIANIPFFCIYDKSEKRQRRLLCGYIKDAFALN